MSANVVVQKAVTLGTWQGMGGAITEATAYNFSKLSATKQRELLDAYYGKRGLDYRWGRIGIGSNDFCLQSFEYTTKKDLSDFSIAHDERWVLPMLKTILAQKPLTLVASPWSPPRSLKFPRRLRYGGRLKPWRYEQYAKYIRKWLEAYAAEGVNVDYITPQNEPRAIQKWESCVYSFRAQRRLAYDYLAKELADLDTQILLWDHNKKHLAKVADKLFGGKNAAQFGHNQKVAGLCYHWYDGICPDQMWSVRQKYPDIMMLSSEMCCGFSPYDERGWQNDAKLYLRELFADINSGSSAWIDWNMLLSWQGGPSYCKNFVKSPVILNEAEDDFILTPIYNALKRFAECFPAGSEIVRCECDSDDIVAVAYKSGNTYRTVIANVSDRTQDATINLGASTQKISLEPLEIKRTPAVRP